MLAIDFQYASKEYRHRTGLEEARFSVEAGSFFGILGPSQSGKSTIVRLLFDYIHPTGGDVLVFEWNSVRDSVRIRQAAGYVPSKVTGHSRMTVHDLLVFLCSGAGRVDEARLRELCMKFHLEPRARFDALEDGERKKLVFVSVLLRDPPLLVLDEPSLGLAPFEREAVFAELTRLHENGSTVLFTTRSVEEIVRYCTHAAILQNGAVLRAGEVREMDFLRARRVTFTADGAPEAAHALGIVNFQGDDRSVSFTYTGSIDTLVKTLAQFTVHTLRIEEPTMESVLVANRVSEGGHPHEAEV